LPNAIKPFTSRSVLSIFDSSKFTPLILAPEKSACVKSHFSKTHFSSLEFLKLTFSKLHKTKILSVKSVFSKSESVKLTFLRRPLPAFFSCWKMEFSITAFEKLHLFISHPEKSKLLNLLSGNVQSVKLTISKTLPEKLDILNSHTSNETNLKFKLINLQLTKLSLLKFLPLISSSENILFLYINRVYKITF